MELESQPPPGPRRDVKGIDVLRHPEAEFHEALRAARHHVDELQARLRQMEAQQDAFLTERRDAKAEAAGILELREVTFAPTACAPDEEASVTNEPAEAETSVITSKRVDRSRRRSGGIAKDEELRMIRKRLAEYDERASSVLGGRLDLSCDKELSLGCLVTSPFFDALAAFVILFNSFVVGWEVEWDAANTQDNPVIQALSSFCNFFFLLEVLLRLTYFRCDFFTNRERRAWNLFDLSLVVLAIVDEVAILMLGTDASSQGAVGAAKMLKMLRILRVFRVFRFFRPLARLALMIMDSIRSLLWAMFMLALITYVFAVSLTSQASLWLSEQVDTSRPGWYASLADHPSPDVRKVFSSFGSLSWTLYTLAQTTLAGVSWHVVCDPLLQVGWLPVSLLLIYISFTLLAVLNVITGVFVDNAFRSADKQHSDIIQKEVDKKEECIALIQAFFHAVDVNHNGEISLDELRFFLDDATMEAFFRTLGFDVYDKQRFMELLDVDDSGEVSYEEFLEAACGTGEWRRESTCIPSSATLVGFKTP